MTTSPQGYIDLFRALLKKGMTHAEAFNQFDREEINAAMLLEMDDYGTKELLGLLAKAGREEMNTEDFQNHAIELMMAGWVAVDTTRDVFSWFWRRPPKRIGKPGRLYRSTGQAWNQYQREKEK